MFQKEVAKLDSFERELLEDVLNAATGAFIAIRRITSTQGEGTEVSVQSRIFLRDCDILVTLAVRRAMNFELPQRQALLAAESKGENAATPNGHKKE